jgi:hypothetical protein
VLGFVEILIAAKVQNSYEFLMPPPVRVLRLLCALAFIMGSSVETSHADAPPTLAAVLDEPALVWSAGGDANWTVVDSPLFAAWSGEYGLGWAALPALGTAWVEAEVTGPGLLEFRWGRAGDATTLFTADGVQLGEANLGPALDKGFFQVPVGVHHVRWSVAAVAAQPINSACMLDRVKWTPNGIAAWTESISVNGASRVVHEL